MKTKVYVYSLNDPETKEVRYIGITSNPNRRLYEHITYKDKLSKNNPKVMWINNLINKDLIPIMNIIEECYETNYYEREKYWISQYNNLTNSTSGGGNIIIYSPELIKRLSEINSGVNNPNYGKKVSDEIREKLRNARKNVILTDEWKCKIRETLGVKCKVFGVEYLSIQESANKYNMSWRAAKRRFDSPDYPEWVLL